MIDFHSHILPIMDDGSDSLEVSIEMLKCLEKQGVDTLCLTSHYYPPLGESVVDFIARRDESFNKLIGSYTGDIKLIEGAEVYYYRGISLNNDLDKLCLKGSDFLLLELPFDNKADVNELYSLNNQLSVVLAHIERYLHIYSVNEFKELSSRGIYLQVNSETFNEKEYGGIKELFECGCINFIGSDSHNMDLRKPNIDIFKGFILEKYGESFYDKYVDKMERTFWSRFK